MQVHFWQMNLRFVIPDYFAQDGMDLQRHLVCFESIRSLQDHEYRSEQECHPRTDPEEIGAELKKAEEQPLSHKESKKLPQFSKKDGETAVFLYFFPTFT